MSEYAEEIGAVEENDESSTQHVTLDNSSQYDIDNSIIGKVKSRVSSILPNRISKWFTTTATKFPDKNSLNGNFIAAGALSKRRRYADDDDNDDDDGDDGNGGNADDYEVEDNEGIDSNDNNIDNEVTVNQTENYRYQRCNIRIRDNCDNDINENRKRQDDENYEDSDITNVRNNINHRGLSSRDTYLTRGPHLSRRPPTKRPRFEKIIEENSPLLKLSQIKSSTPASSGLNKRQYVHVGSTMPRSSQNHGINKEPAYDFSQATVKPVESNLNIPFITSIYQRDAERGFNDHCDQNTSTFNHDAQRRSLNIPPLSSTCKNVTASERFSNTMLQLKRQPLLKVKKDIRASPNQMHNVSDNGNVSNNDDDTNIRSEMMQKGPRIKNANKRQKLLNGSTDRKNEIINLKHNTYNSDESNNNTLPKYMSVSNNDNHNVEQFNQIHSIATTAKIVDNTNSDDFSNKHHGGSCYGLGNSSRTSSFSNDLNFYSHLEGHKSLFAGNNSISVNDPTIKNSTLNNSTLSLSSLNRRQFNASIYSSTSALSDSRLLHTFSPFYKGKTTYGGAAAYNKQYGTNIGMNSTTLRMTPTIVRPTSSLSMSSNVVLNNIDHNRYLKLVGDNNTSMSNTAKRILDLIMDINTPLSEAKKMAHSLRSTTQQSRKQIDTDNISTSKIAPHGIRLTHAPKPYSRPSSAVLLQPTKSNDTKIKAPLGGSIIPPIKELHVPSMSQLLQIKRMHNTTEKIRCITEEGSKNNCKFTTVATSTISAAVATPAALSKEYCVPPVYNHDQINGSSVMSQQVQQQYKLKMKSKVSGTLRSMKGVTEEAPPAPPNLPNIQFPIMKSKPTIDIHLPTVVGTCTNRCKVSESSSLSTLNTSIPTGIITTTENYTFSVPQNINSTLLAFPNENLDATECVNNYKFPTPILMSRPSSNASNTRNNTPLPLKTGSVLEALKGQSNFSLQLSNANTSFEASVKIPSFSNKSTKNQMPNTQNECKTIEENTPAMEINPMSTRGNIKSNDEWISNKCMKCNNKDATGCKCEEIHQVNCTAPSLSSATTNVQEENSFANVCTSKLNSWECKTCLIVNNININQCVACQNKRPESMLPFNSNKNNINTVSPTSANFSFSNAGNHILSPTSKIPDADFKALSTQQKRSTWECETCMTRNDISRNRCACCEELKPGVKKGDCLNDNFVDASKSISNTKEPTTKYIFGFGSIISAAKQQNEITDLNRQNTNSVNESKTHNTVETTLQTQCQSQMLQSTKNTYKLDGSNLDSHKNNDIPDSKCESQQQQLQNNSNTKEFLKSSPVLQIPKESGITYSNFNFGFQKRGEFSTITSSSVGTTSNASTPSVTFNLTSEFKENNKANISEATQINSAPGFNFGSGSSNKQNVINSTHSVTTTTTIPTFTVALTVPNSNCNNSTNNTTIGSSACGTNATTEKNTFECITPITTVATMNSAESTTVNVDNDSNAITDTAASSKTSASGAFSGIVSSSTSNLIGNTSSNIFAIPNTNNNKLPTTVIFNSFNNNNSSLAKPTDSQSVVSSTKITDGFAFSTSKAKPTLTTTTTTATPPIASTSQQTLLNSSSTLPQSSLSTTSSIPTSSIITNVSTTAWPKNNFSFGTSNNTTTNIKQQKQDDNVRSTPMFTFGSGNVSTDKTKSIFGTSSTTVPVLPGDRNQPTALFGTTSLPSLSQKSPSNIFGSNSPLSSSNIFGATATTQPHVFGNTSFGSAPLTAQSPSAIAPTTTSIPTFGSSSSTANPVFGGFGTLTSNEAKNSPFDVNKTSNSVAFTFGANSNNTTVPNQNVGFNFGSAATNTSAPVFNFGGTGVSGTVTQPTFNFTGMNEQSQNTAKPFQFGATPATPFYKFTGGAAEVSQNTPFQFNATPTTISSNVFAPSPTPSAQSTQQVRRKIRTTRRLTPR